MAELLVHLVDVGALVPEVAVLLVLQLRLVRVECQVLFDPGHPLLEGVGVGAVELVVFGAELCVELPRDESPRGKRVADHR